MISPLLKFEYDLWDQGLRYIAGVDEAGRGPLAGPIVIATVILDRGALHNKEEQHFEQELLQTYQMINDSKKVTEKRRNILFDFIKEEAIGYAIHEISHEEIDIKGIGNANYEGFQAAVTKLKVRPDHFLTDHFKIPNLENRFQSNIIKGDSVSMTIAAASILAKVYRDKVMLEMHEKYPEYGFDKHKGYGTKVHREAILKYGPCKIHRKTFEPTKSYLKNKEKGLH